MGKKKVSPGGKRQEKKKKRGKEGIVLPSSHQPNNFSEKRGDQKKGKGEK